MRAEGSGEAGGRRAILENPGHRLIAEASRQEAAMLANGHQQRTGSLSTNGQSLAQRLSRTVASEESPIIVALSRAHCQRAGRPVIVAEV